MGRFLQRLADTSSASSILGDLPPEEIDPSHSGRREGTNVQPGGQGTSADVESRAGESVRLASSTAKVRVRAAGDGERDEGSGGAQLEDNIIGVASGERNGIEAGDAGEQHRRGVQTPVLEPPDAEGTAETAGGDELLHEAPPPQLPPHLVLFARAKGRPFVYCGEVDCVAQEYVGSAGSARLGAVKLTLALRQWREAAAATTDSIRSGAGGYGSGNGGGERGEVGVEIVDMYRKSNEFSLRGGLQFEERSDVFADVVQEGLRPPSL